MTNEAKSVLALLAEPFPRSDWEYRPEVTCSACAENRCASHDAKRCGRCKVAVTTAHICLAYVGHAKVTRRLNSVCPMWTWETMTPQPAGYAGLWIRLIVTDENGAAHSRPGMSANPDPKEAESEAIRRAAMRFGCGLELWEEKTPRPKNDGRRGIGSNDGRIQLWDFARAVHGWCGRRSSASILDHWDAWAEGALPEAAPERDLSAASPSVLRLYLADLLRESAAR